MNTFCKIRLEWRRLFHLGRRDENIALGRKAQRGDVRVLHVLPLLLHCIRLSIICLSIICLSIIRLSIIRLPIVCLSIIRLSSTAR